MDYSWSTSITDAYLSSASSKAQIKEFPADLPLQHFAATKERLTPVVYGLLRMDKMGMLLHLWRESLVQVLKQNVREALPEIPDAASAGPNAANLKEYSFY